MLKIVVDMASVRQMLALDPFYRTSEGHVSPFWKIAYHAAGFADEFPLPDCDEARWLVELIKRPLVSDIVWKFHGGSDGGTWLGDTSHSPTTYSVWESRGKGIMTTLGHNFPVHVGATADDAKRLADIHWSLKALGTLSDDFLRKQLTMIAEGRGE